LQEVHNKLGALRAALEKAERNEGPGTRG
jgi:hypothetical protein